MRFKINDSLLYRSAPVSVVYSHFWRLLKSEEEDKEEEDKEEEDKKEENVEEFDEKSEKSLKKTKLFFCKKAKKEKSKF